MLAVNSAFLVLDVEGKPQIYLGVGIYLNFPPFFFQVEESLYLWSIFCPKKGTVIEAIWREQNSKCSAGSTGKYREVSPRTLARHSLGGERDLQPPQLSSTALQAGAAAMTGDPP